MRNGIAMPKPYEKTSAMHTILSEEELVAVLKTGASKGLGILYQMYSRALLNVIVQMIKDRAIAEDTLQLVWLKVWSEGRNYDPGKGRVYTWLLNIARNTAIDTYRSQAYRVFSRSMCFEDHPECLEQFKSRGLNIDAIGLREIVAGLEEKQREVLELVYFQEYTHTEAAAQLAIPLGTIKTRLRKAKAHLRSYFDEDRLRTVRRKITKAQRRFQSSSYRSLAEISLAMEMPNEAPKLKRRAGRPKNPIARPRNPIARTKNPIVRTTKPKKESMRYEVIRLYRQKTMGMTEIAKQLGIKLSTAFYYTRDLPKNGSLRRRKADTSALPPPKPLKPRIYEMALKIKHLHDLKTMTHTQIGAQLGISSMKVGRYLFALNSWEAYQKEKKI